MNNCLLKNKTILTETELLLQNYNKLWKHNRIINNCVDNSGSKARRSRTCALPSGSEAIYLKDEIAFGARLVEVRTVTPSSFRSLFLKILQDLESEEHKIIDRKRETHRPEERIEETFKIENNYENGSN